MVEFPTGTVTFLFSDLEVSTRLWEREPDAMRGALRRHDFILREAVDANGGRLVKGTGDGIHAAFATASAAVDAAIACQLTLGDEPWVVSEPLRVRMGIHTGVAEFRDGDYFGPAVNRAARLMSAAHGGQIVVSLATEELVRDVLPAGVELLELGEHHLRDVGRSEYVFQIRHPRLPREFPPLRSLEHRPKGNLPVYLTSFVGRDRELEAVRDALGQARVVTLIGVGGVGKTRLALQAAADAALIGYSDGVWFCELALVTDRLAVPGAIAACIGVREQPGESLTASVVAFLRHKQLLLVLDNCEHVIAAAGALAEAIAHACPHVVVLATSREALGIDGELLRPVGSLGIPDEGAAAGEVMTASSVRLFADRAQAVRPDFELESVNAPAVADICRQLDGVPLAIELAAARVSSMTVAEIAQRLDQRFRLLTGGRRTALERHQTLRGVVDWSYDLLDETEARVFNRLAVFAGGFTLEAAEAVVNDERIEVDEVLDALARLVARHMLVADDSGGVTRYRLLETMRQYARERLEGSGEAEAIRLRHAEHYVTLAEAAEVGLKGPDEEHWVRIVDSEFANFRAAFDWSHSAGDADLALRSAVALAWYSVTRPRYGVWHWLELANEMAEAHHHRLRPRAMTLSAGGAVGFTGGPAMVADRVRTMDAAFEDAGLELTSDAHFAHAILASVTGRGDEAIEQGTLAVELARAAGDSHLMSLQGSLLSLLLANYGELERAVREAEKALALGSELANPTLLALSEVALGSALSTIDPERALPHLEAGVSLGKLVGNDMARDIGERYLAQIRAAGGNLIGALETYVTVLQHATESATLLPSAFTARSIAVDLAAAGYNELAATMFGALEAQLDADQGDPLVRREGTLEILRRAMGATHFDECTTRGRAMDQEQLAAFVTTELTHIITELSNS